MTLFYLGWYPRQSRGFKHVVGGWVKAHLINIARLLGMQQGLLDVDVGGFLACIFAHDVHLVGLVVDTRRKVIDYGSGAIRVSSRLLLLGRLASV